LGAVMVLALVISYTNLTSGPAEGNAQARIDGPDEAANVSADQVVPYQQQESYLQQAESNEEAWKRKPAPTASPAPTEATAPPLKPAEPSPPAVKPAAPTVPPASTPPVPQSGETNDTGSGTTAGEGAADTGTVGEAADTGAAAAETEAVEIKADAPVEAKPVAAEADEPKETSFAPFTGEDKMAWPVQGEIAMVFSTDKLIYDPTLDQYRTNDDLRIAVQEGTPVKAGADGKVLSVGNDHVYGNYVQIDHGNGWVASYGQLMDGVLVREGDTVSTGQVIGGVGQPSYYGSLNGTHMNLRLTKDNEPVDPRSVLTALNGE
jgi:murein DD-endopeptidase MepM/ murein hydrolase activator NlpD